MAEQFDLSRRRQTLFQKNVAMACAVSSKDIVINFNEWHIWRWRLWSTTELTTSIHPVDEFGHAFYAPLLYEVREGKFVELPLWMYHLAGMRFKRIINPEPDQSPEQLIKDSFNILMSCIGWPDRGSQEPLIRFIDNTEAIKIWGELLNE